MNPCTFVRPGWLALVLASLPPSASALEVLDVEVVDLGVAEGDVGSVARDINDDHEIVGYSFDASETNRPFRHAEGTMHMLPTPVDASSASATAINARGQIVGTARTHTTGNEALIWEDGAVLGLRGSLSDERLRTSARDINDRQQVAGVAGIDGVVWDMRRTTEASPYPPFEVLSIDAPVTFEIVDAYAINNLGQVVGHSHSTDAAFLWEDGTFTELTPFDDRGKEDHPYGINAYGWVVGVAFDVESRRSTAALWRTPDDIVELGSFGGSYGVARDINNGDVIVGSSETEAGHRQAFIWHEDFGMHELDSLGGTESRAYAINRAGNVVGFSENASGQRHATLWRITYGPRLILPSEFFGRYACFPFARCPFPYFWIALFAVILIAIAAIGWRFSRGRFG